MTSITRRIHNQDTCDQSSGFCWKWTLPPALNKTKPKQRAYCGSLGRRRESLADLSSRTVFHSSFLALRQHTPFCGVLLLLVHSEAFVYFIADNPDNPGPCFRNALAQLPFSREGHRRRALAFGGILGLCSEGGCYR